jgi:hypothetical protein
MEMLTSAEDLKNAIQILEVEKEVKLQKLKEQVQITMEELNPKNLLINSITDFTASPTVFDKITGVLIGLLSGYISKRLLIAGSGNKFRKIAGTVLHLLIIKILASHPEKVTSLRHLLLQKLFKNPVAA